MNWKKITLYVVLGLVLTALAVTLVGNWVVQSYLSTDAIRARLESSLNRSVRLSGFDFSIWSGIELRGLDVSRKDGFSDGQLLSARSVHLKPDFWILLTSRFSNFVLRNATVTDPVFKIRRNEQGFFDTGASYDTQNTVPTNRMESNRSAEEETSTAETTSEPAQIRLTVDRVQFKNGSIFFEDKLIDRSDSFTFSSVVLTNFQLDEGGSLSVDSLRKEETELSGKFSIKRNPLSLGINDLSVEKLALTDWKTYFEDQIPQKYRPVKGIVNLAIEDGILNKERSELKGTIKLNSFGVETPPDQIPLPESISMSGTFTRPRKQTIRMALNGVKFDSISPEGSIDLEVNQLFESPRFQGEISLSNLPVGAVYDRISGSLPETVQDLSLNGALEKGDVGVSGSLDDFSIEGNVNFSEILVKSDRLAHPLAVRGLSVDLVEPDDLNFSGELRSKNEKFSISGQLKQYLSSKRQMRMSARGNDISLSTMAKLIRNYRKFPLSIREIKGSMGSLEVSVQGPLKKPDYSISGNLRETEFGLWKFPHKFSSISGEFSAEPSSVSFRLANGKYASQPFKLSGEIPLPFKMENSLEMTGSFKKFPLSDGLEVIDDIKLPDGYKITGDLSSNNISVNGSLKNVKLGGSVNIRDGRLVSPMIKKPLTDLSAKADLQGQLLRIKHLSTKLGSRLLTGAGSVRLNPNVNVDLTLQGDSYPVPFIVEHVESIPALPEGWKPDGNLNGMLNVKGQFTNPNVTGELTSSDLSIGPIETSNVLSKIKIEDRKLNVEDLSLSVFGGSLTGKGSLDLSSRSLPTSFDLEVGSIDPGNFMKTFFTVGQESTGQLGGSLNMSGSLKQLQKLDGSTNLFARDLVLKDVKLFSRLSQVLNLGFKRGSDGNLLLPIDSSSSTRFKKGDVKVRFKKGNGEIQNFNFVNKDLSLNGEGTVTLDGKINLAIGVTPRSALLQEVDQGWLRNSLEGGLPTVNVSGTIFDPKYNVKSFTEKLTEQILKNRVQQEINDAINGLFD